MAEQAKPGSGTRQQDKNRSGQSQDQGSGPRERQEQQRTGQSGSREAEGRTDHPGSKPTGRQEPGRDAEGDDSCECGAEGAGSGDQNQPYGRNQPGGPGAEGSTGAHPDGDQGRAARARPGRDDSGLERNSETDDDTNPRQGPPPM